MGARTLADGSTWLTVVTVVKDDVSGMTDTLASLASQDLDSVQYVVVDGSADRAAVPLLLRSGPRADYEWTDPEGIYPAMNTGLTAARGRFVYFANAGDVLENDVLARVRALVTPIDPIWAFGRVDICRPGEQTPVPQPAWEYGREIRHFLARRRFPPHQGVFMRASELRRQGGFDLRYRVTADYLSVLRAGRIAAPLELDLTVARFTIGGQSTTEWRAGLREFHRARLDALDLGAVDRVHEAWHTSGTWARTAIYRGLLAR